MSQVTVTLDDRLDRVVSIVKSISGVSSKEKAIQMIIDEAGGSMVERALRPEFVKHILSLEKRGKFKKYSSLEKLWGEIERA